MGVISDLIKAHSEILEDLDDELKEKTKEITNLRLEIADRHETIESLLGDIGDLKLEIIELKRNDNQ